MSMVVRPREAASSSSTTFFACSFDVFLSFRGLDTRKNFTDHLYTALRQAGIRTFRDNDEIGRGESLKPGLDKAIKESAISIIVFSENYASSKWCLDEVLMILEHKRSGSKHEVIPVFYKVEPSDVGNQRGSFAEAFYQHRDRLIETETDHEKKKEGIEKVKAWREALKEAADLTGMVLAADGHEAIFIQEIVSMIVRKLDRKPLFVEGHLVGITPRIDGIDSWLRDGSSSVNILVIHGIGGIGKTTIAKCIYNSNFYGFEGSCFLANIREMSDQSNGLIHLQRQLISTILKRRNEEIVIWNVDEGTTKVEDAISSKRVLIILDDVIERNQLNALLGRQKFYPGSKVIITTRQKGLLNSLKVCYKVHTVEKFDWYESLELFSWYAFQQDHPKEACMEKSKVITRRCGGLPLALKVLGSSLFGRHIDVWDSALRKLEAIPNPGIQKILKVSFESLEDDEDKNLFLHVACFFVGEDKDYIVTILEQCDLYPTVGIQNLTDRCMLDIDENKLMMHQLIQEMGREIVRQESPEEPGKRSRLWHHKDSFNILKEQTGTRKIKGIILDMRTLKEDKTTRSAFNTKKRCYEEFLGKSFLPNDEKLKFDSFKKMENLMLLQLNYVRLTGNFKKLPKRLRWLCWHGFPLESIPNGVSLEKLVALDMHYSKLVVVWKEFKFLETLKILNLSYSKELVRTPNFMGLPRLESLILKGCVGLVVVCESITKLERLVLLDLEDCKSLKNIPCLPNSLVTLKMSGCLNLGGVGQDKWLVSLPNSLVTSNIQGCNLTDDSFPRDMSHLFSLQSLDRSENAISALPDCVKSLNSLGTLDIEACQQLQSVLGLPNTIQRLSITKNKSLVEVVGVQNSILFFDSTYSRKLAEVEGCFKLAPLENVEKRIMRLLDLESILVGDKELDLDGKQKLSTKNIQIKVLYEFGIFSTYVHISGRHLPSCFTYKEEGSKISFSVPSSPNNLKIQAFNLCFTSSVLDTEANEWGGIDEVEISNKTKNLKLKYRPPLPNLPCGVPDFGFDYVFLSLWKCGNLLEGGDEIDVRITVEYRSSRQPEECCINLIYEDNILEEDRNVEAKEEVETVQHNGLHKSLSWTDKTYVKISDYIHSGKTYFFSSYERYYPDDIQCMDWWGPKPNWDSRDITFSF